jgi:adenylate kinase
MLNIVIFGAPGSGKGTQSDLIIKEYGLEHISTGDVLRAEIKNETELGKTAKSYMDNGKLVPDSLIIDILASVLDSKGKEINGVIFDGFPRTIAQAEALNAMLAERGTAVSAVVGLEVPDEELVKRIIARGKTSGRSDDNEETAKKRLDTYYSQTLPLKDFYINEGKYAKIEGVGSIEGIFADIKKAIDAVK